MERQGRLGRHGSSGEGSGEVVPSCGLVTPMAAHARTAAAFHVQRRKREKMRGTEKGKERRREGRHGAVVEIMVVTRGDDEKVRWG